jgi:hypothetical protein
MMGNNKQRATDEAIRRISHEPEFRHRRMNTGKGDYVPLPEVVVAGVVIEIDRVDDRPGTVVLLDKDDHRLAEVPNVARVVIGTT